MRALTLTTIRAFLGIVFIVYGLTKLLGGQFFYGDWVLDKGTVDGPFLVWAFYGYSPLYARFIGLAELIPGIMLLIPRTATVGAAALFAVALNVTVMDFAFGFPSVKYAVLFYTVLLGVLLWADRRKLLPLVQRDDPSAAGARASAGAEWRSLPRPVRVTFAAVALAFLLFAANVLGTSLDAGPEDAARAVVERQQPAGTDIQLLRSNYRGLLGLNRSAVVQFVVTRQGAADTVELYGRKATGFSRWVIRSDSITPR